jgi:hypothetical protein
MKRADSRSLELAQAIEYWIAALFVSGAFIAGIVEGFSILAGG